MASVAVARVLVAMMLIQLSSELELKLTESEETDILFHIEGEDCFFEYISKAQVQSDFTAILYRSTEDGRLFLKNTSNPSQQSESEQTKRVVQVQRSFVLKNLSLSDSGGYVTQRWRKRMLKEKRNYNLIVCKDKCENVTERHWGRDRIEVLLKKEKVSHGNTLQVYKREYKVDAPGIVPPKLVLDTKLPLEVQPDGQRREVELSDNSTKISFSPPNNRDSYSIVIRTGSQCCVSIVFSNIWKSGTRGYSVFSYVLQQDERVMLPCSSLTQYAEEIVWNIPGGNLSVDVSVPFNVSHQEEVGMYIQPSNYSLVIPSVGAEHTGFYQCEPDYMRDSGRKTGTYLIFVCSDVEAIYERFSLGDALYVDCGVGFNVTEAKFEFYRHGGQNEEHLSEKKIITSTSSGIKARRWRITNDWMFFPYTKVNEIDHFSLTSANLTLNDSGLYVCRIWGYAKKRKPFCYDRKIYLLYKHPFGIDSTFYRVYSSLMACGLLGMICAVIFVHLRVRGRDRTSKERLRRTAEPCRTREGEQTGGEPDHDDVNTAEDLRE